MDQEQLTRLAQDLAEFSEGKLPLEPLWHSDTHQWCVYGRRGDGLFFSKQSESEARAICRLVNAMPELIEQAGRVAELEEELERIASDAIDAMGEDA